MAEAITSSDFDIELRLLLDAIHLRYQYDFRSYAVSSLRRRLAHAQTRLGFRTLSALQERVLREPALFNELLAFLTVHVSDMYRDPAFFLFLRQHVVPFLHTYPSLKVWIAGCSSGEEAYALAILLREESLLERAIIYASDISPQALQKAEAGIFGLERVAQWSENYRAAGGRASLSDYYTAAYGGAVLDRSLRRNMVFCDHSLATDEVFAEVQLITCRNVLIYFNRELQNRAFGLFANALCPGGFLGLGAKETLRFSPHADQFTLVGPVAQVYRKRWGQP